MFPIPLPVIAAYSAIAEGFVTLVFCVRNSCIKKCDSDYSKKFSTYEHCNSCSLRNFTSMRIHGVAEEIECSHVSARALADTDLKLITFEFVRGFYDKALNSTHGSTHGSKHNGTHASCQCKLPLFIRRALDALHLDSLDTLVCLEDIFDSESDSIGEELTTERSLSPTLQIREKHTIERIVFCNNSNETSSQTDFKIYPDTFEKIIEAFESHAPNEGEAM